jgi:hypothetical protein
MANLLEGLVKGLSGFLPQDDPDVKILNAQTELKDLCEKEEKIYARLGRQVYADGGGENHPETKAELDLLATNRRAVESRLLEAKAEKEARERATAASEQEAMPAPQFCSNCGATLAAGMRFCSSCGSKTTEF